MTTTNFGLPTEFQLESLANSLFPDLDPERCAEGIANLATSGDTSVIYDAAAKAESYAGGVNYFTSAEQAASGYGSFSELERIANEYNGGGFGDYEAVADSFGASPAVGAGREYAAHDTYTVPQEQPTPEGVSPYVGSAQSYVQPEGYTAANVPGVSEVESVGQEQPAQTGYSPVVLSQTQADSYAPKTAPSTVSAETRKAESDNSHIIVGTKTLAQIRDDFPILKEKINGHDLVWLDNGATTQRPQAVIDRLKYYYEHENSNVHRGAHELAARSTDAYENARQITADFIGAPSKDNIVFVRGTTEAINLVANAYVKPLLKPGDEIILTMLEHHANIVPWQLVCEETGAVIKVVPVDQTGQIIISEYEKLFTRRTKFVSATHVSNALGTVTPVEEIVAIAHAHGVRTLIDGAQSIAHIPINVSALDTDFFVFSGHKIFAPTGIGAVYGKKDVLDAARPYHGGGNMIKDVTFERTIYNPAPNKFEAGTGSIADAVGLGAALEYLNSIGMAEVNRHEHELLVYAMKEMRKINGLHLIGTATNKASVLSFVLDGVDNEAVGQRLNELGIAVRTGHHCAQPILRHFGLEGTVRPTLALYNSFGDIDRLVEGIRSLT
ncbi:cysteine desulfurase / selenocysteine lyase [Ruminococcus sp. YE71]|uniref:cysteine desulfurase n=1 Tax=unclassified Ruminococcus TaxID=2608920 RepID=UPI0008894D10|nr:MULTISPECIES: cysteine desulfurase [unclassified Ruminococcus]SDA13245.1 cysteine desulfurase / selenocysteine lyase [Ruminococcus sp. YE78]SFW18726.1 cysteine desulfurase / selenocysteine lyase [Ruminococcus sp. YE71]